VVSGFLVFLVDHVVGTIERKRAVKFGGISADRLPWEVLSDLTNLLPSKNSSNLSLLKKFGPECSPMCSRANCSKTGSLQRTARVHPPVHYLGPNLINCTMVKELRQARIQVVDAMYVHFRLTSHSQWPGSISNVCIDPSRCFKDREKG